MNDAVGRMLARYEGNSSEDSVRALREILQEIALLGLWRSKFFDKAAFYGGTALRIFYGMERFSEDLDFSLLVADDAFDMSKYFKPIIVRFALHKEKLTFISLFHLKFF